MNHDAEVRGVDEVETRNLKLELMGLADRSKR